MKGLKCPEKPAALIDRETIGVAIAKDAVGIGVDDTRCEARIAGEPCMDTAQ